MISVGLKPLVDKLNAPARRALEGAAGLCLSRSHYSVEIEHWLMKLLEEPKGDLPILLEHFDVDASRFAASLTRVLDRLKTGNSRAPSLAPNVVDLLRDAWLAASVDFEEPTVRSGHLLYTLLASDELSRTAAASLPELESIDAAALKRDFASILAHSTESGERPEPRGAGKAARGGAPAGGGGRGQALGQFTIDLTERARRGEIDPVLGRDAEIRQLIDILCRRRQNNPILTGEAGVGKTAVAEGFARRIAEGDVPPNLADVSLLTLDLGLLQAGAGVKGEFENRLKSVIEEVKASPKPIILFIDEAHTLIGAGGSAGQGDAANLLKPALARGELRTIAATTWAEYKKYFERDAALARRFQVVKVEEPAEASAVEIMRGLADTMRAHHKVRLLDEAVVDSVRLSMRYISGRQLPDKSVSVLDTACARVAIGLSSTPAGVEDLRRRIVQLETAIRSLERESASGAKHEGALEEYRADLAATKDRLAALEQRWEQEKALVTKIHEIHEQIEGNGAPAAGAPDAAGRLVELDGLRKELKTLQGETPLVHPHVDAQAVAEVVAAWTGIPVGRMVTDEIQAVISLRDRMEERVVGQTHALEAIAQRVRTGRAGLTDPKRPIGVFMLAGPSGVGKTETAIALAEILYGGEQNMTVINMSEFKEEHKVSLLMGSPPGYVGYGEGGVLTEAVRRKPYSVVLLDEMEKAAVGVQDVFYQVFDKGSLRDGEGRDIDFRNTLILMTSNLGTDKIVSLCADPETRPDADALGEAIRPDLLGYFKPAFLGRVNVIPYFPLDDDTMKRIVRLQLGRIISRVRQHYGATLTYTDQVVETIASRCTEVHTGARNVDHIVSRTLLPELASEFLSAMAAEKPIGAVEIDVAEGAFAYRLS